MVTLLLEATGKASRGGTGALRRGLALAGPYGLYGALRAHVARLEDGTEMELWVGVACASPTRQLLVDAC